MVANHELGASVICAIRESHDFARTCIVWLLSKQDDDEISQGTSLRRNDEGLSKIHAAQLDKKASSDMSHTELKSIASAYSHTQLADAVAADELTLPTKRKRRTLQLSETDSESDTETLDEEQWQEDHEGKHQDEGSIDDDPDLVVDRFGIHHGPLCIPSKQLCTRVASIVERIRRVNRKPPWNIADVKKVINDENGWLLGMEADENCIDAALYNALPTLDFSASRQPKWIRCYWKAESIWGTARVDLISRKHGSDVRVKLFFPADNASGILTGADALYAYELI